MESLLYTILMSARDLHAFTSRQRAQHEKNTHLKICQMLPRWTTWTPITWFRSDQNGCGSIAWVHCVDGRVLLWCCHTNISHDNMVHSDTPRLALLTWHLFTLSKIHRLVQYTGGPSLCEIWGGLPPLTPSMDVYIPYRRPPASLMAHMKGMVMGDMLEGLGTRLRPRARAPELDYAPRELSRRYAPMAQKEPIGASVCTYGTVIRMSVHP